MRKIFKNGCLLQVAYMSGCIFILNRAVLFLHSIFTYFCLYFYNYLLLGFKIYVFIYTYLKESGDNNEYKFEVEKNVLPIKIIY